METLQEQLNEWSSDFEKYAANNLFIIDKDAQLVPFILNRMQRKVWRLILYFLVNGLPIRILCIKDRQIGFTTLIAGIFYWIATLSKNKNCLIVSYDTNSASGIFNKVKLFFKCSKDELRPLRKISNRRELYFANPNESGELGLESRVVIDTADSEELGVSYTIQFALLSELAIWESMGLDIKKRLVALNQSIPERAGTGIIIETTPRGEGYVSNMWFDTTNGFEKIFISSVADEEYRIEISPLEYFTLADYDEHKYGNEVDEYLFYESEVKQWYPEINYTLELGMQQLHHEVMCRLAWRRATIDKKCEGDKEIFDREYPITIDKAFANSGSKIFPQKILTDIKKHIKLFPAIVTRYKFEKEFKDFCQNNGGGLKVFQEPHPEFKYVIGADVGQGAKGGDSSAMVCRRLPDLKQVFTFNELLDSLSFARVINCAGRIYNTAFIAPEVNEKGGYATCEYLLNMFFYRNMYIREVMVEVGKPKTKKYGWYTSRHTKPVMQADLTEALHEGLEILDLDELEQLIKYQLIVVSDKYGDTKTLTGVVSGHDDLAIAEMICIQLPKYVSLAAEKKPKNTKWTLKWWESKIQNDNESYIGNALRGPIN